MKFQLIKSICTNKINFSFMLYREVKLCTNKQLWSSEHFCMFSMTSIEILVAYML